MRDRKEMACDFLMRCAKGDVQEAFRLYAGQGFMHHNPGLGGDAPALMAAMEEAARAT